MATKKPSAVARETSPDTSLQIETPPDGAPVVARGGDVKVWMPPARAPGVRAFGDLVPGTVYAVPAAEALRLVTVKRFRFADAASQSAVTTYIDGIADAIDTTPKE